MSIRVMQWVWDHSQSQNAARLVLLAIADNASDDGGNAYPSNATLQRKANLSERGVRSAVAKLIEIGELRANINGGRSGTNMYQVVMTPAGSAPPKPVNPAGSAPQQGQDLPHPPAGSAPRTVTEPSGEPKPSASQRGTRLPEGWRPSDDLLNWAREKAPGVGWAEHEKFVDWARSASGSVAVKKDWDAAWRNWMRRASEQRGARPVSGPPSGQYKNSQEQQIERSKISKARSKILDALMDEGRTFDQAKAEIEGLTDEDFLKLVAPSTVTGYIEGDVINETQRPEVES